MKSKSFWNTILKIVIAVVTAVASAVGISSCMRG